MSFVSLGGDGSTKPTFFELIAAEKLMPSLKAATVYSLSVSVRPVLFLKIKYLAAGAQVLPIRKNVGISKF